ncbi:MAG TPA: alpha/beta hydrolase-fold protein [Vicinamibacterales bacterium]|nr:alpha/beta hydrolase-fold protein [Vicinamibacterales bacterium]
MATHASHLSLLLACAILAPAGRAQAPVQRTFPNAPQGFDVRREGVSRGRVDRVEYDSTVTGNKRPAMVYMPPGYSARQRYPVLYLLHGLGANEATWTDDLAADQILDNLIADKKALPMIVVMPNGRASNEPVADPRVPRVEMQAHAAFEKELIADLIPFIESHYSADRSRERRALAGLSLGGWQSLSFGLGNLNTFAWVAGFSSALQASPPAQLVRDPIAVRGRLKLLWVSCGDQDTGSFSMSEGLHSYLAERNVPHVWHIDVGGGHTVPVWKNDLYHLATLLFR